jgi:hypothetical protein
MKTAKYGNVEFILMNGSGRDGLSRIFWQKKNVVCENMSKELRVKKAKQHYISYVLIEKKVSVVFSYVA